MKAYWDPAQLRHAPQFFLQRGQLRRNLEVPARAEALLAAARAMQLDIATPGTIDRATLESVHSAAYLDFLRDAAPSWQAQSDHGPEAVANIHPTPEMFGNGARLPKSAIGQLGWYTADTSCPIGPNTWTAAIAASSCAVAAAEEVAQGRHAYAICRPPGHHAYPARAGGHCYLNNAALAAQRLRDLGLARVAILDIDSHHGNGTQAVFWGRADVLFTSIHGDPDGYYPFYVGHAQERGGGRGFGCNLNLPLKRGSDDADWLDALDHALSAIHAFGADALVVSLGFDASVHEPLQYLAVSSEGFARAGQMIAASRLKSAIIQEGGYNLSEIGGLLTRFLAAFG